VSVKCRDPLSLKGNDNFVYFFSLLIKVSENRERRRKRASEQLKADLSTGKAREKAITC